MSFSNLTSSPTFSALQTSLVWSHSVWLTHCLRPTSLQLSCPSKTPKFFHAKGPQSSLIKMFCENNSIFPQNILKKIQEFSFCFKLRFSFNQFSKTENIIFFNFQFANMAKVKPFSNSSAYLWNSWYSPCLGLDYSMLKRETQNTGFAECALQG